MARKPKILTLGRGDYRVLNETRPPPPDRADVFVRIILGVIGAIVIRLLFFGPVHY